MDASTREQTWRHPQDSRDKAIYIYAVCHTTLYDMLHLQVILPHHSIIKVADTTMLTYLTKLCLRIFRMEAHKEMP